MKNKVVICLLALLCILAFAACGAEKQPAQEESEPEIIQQPEEIAEEQAAPKLPEEVVKEEPLPEEELLPEEEPLDPNSVLLPDLADFLLSDKDFNKAYSSGGRRYEVGPIPDAAYGDVVAEVQALLEEPRYQLEPEGVDSSYNDDGSGESHDYYYRYTGTNPNIFYVDHEWKDVSFHVMLKVYDLDYDDGNFDIGLFFCENFEEEIAGKYTTRRTDKDSDGGLRGPDEFPQKQPESNGGDWEHNSDLYNHTPPASKLKCLTCDGDGDCNTCGGDGYKNIGGAKAGCNTCRGNGKCRTCGGSGTR